MDAKSPGVYPAQPEPVGLRDLLVQAPVLPYALSAFGGTCLGFYGSALDSSVLPVWTACLTVFGLGALLCPRVRKLGALSLFFALGLVVGAGGRPPDLSSIDPDVPVELEGRVASHPRGTPGEEWLWLRVDRWTYRQTSREGLVDVLVGLPEGQRPAELEAPAWGQRVRLRGYLRTSPVLDNGVATRPGPRRLNLPSWRFWDVTAPPAAWQRFASALRHSLARRLASSTASSSVSSLSSQNEVSLGRKLRLALLLGSPDDLPESLRRRLRATGLSHLLAVSGLHVGLLAGWLWLVGMPCGRRVRLLLALAGVAAYLLLVGPKASALRAAGMAGLVAGALLLRRPPQALNAAALWATALVLWDPQALDDLGYRLSVAATLGILAFGPGLSRSLADAGRRIGLRGRGVQLVCQGLGVSLAAQLSTLPLLTPWTGLVHPAAPWLNLLAIPWLTAFLGLSFLSAACLGVLDRVFVPLLDVAAVPIELLAAAPPSAWTTLPMSLPMSLPPMSVPMSLPMSVAACLAASAALLALVLRPAASLRLALVICLLGLPGGPPRGGTEPLEFIRLDVGQGDALLLRDGPHTLLVDGGGWRRGDLAARVLVPALAHLGIRRLDAVVLTHPDTDHCRGLVDLASYLPVGEVWMSPGWSDPCAQDLLGSSDATWRSLWRGDRSSVGRWDLEVLWPPPGLRRGEANDRSLVLRASGGRQRILLAADVTTATERRLIRLEGDGLRSTILGVGHHGSKTSTSRAFLRQLSPAWATVGVGARNAYGHPHPTVVDRLELADVRLHRTDRMGALRWVFDPVAAPFEPDPQTGPLSQSVPLQ